MIQTSLRILRAVRIVVFPLALLRRRVFFTQMRTLVKQGQFETIKPVWHVHHASAYLFLVNIRLDDGPLFPLGTFNNLSQDQGNAHSVKNVSMNIKNRMGLGLSMSEVI